jgi:hypothetical protein
LLNNHTKDKHELTRLITHTTISDTYQKEKSKILKFKNTSKKDDYIFNIRVYNESSEVVSKTIDEIVSA